MEWARIVHDLSYAFRTLRRSPGFAVAAVLTLALGIGATTAIYSVVDTILLQPLPFRDADSLVQIVEQVPSSVPGHGPYQRGVTYQEFLEWRARSTTLSDAFAVSTGENVARTRQGAARLWGASVSANLFTALGVSAMVGRTLVAADDSNPNVVVLSFESWRRVFDSRTDAIGATLEFKADFNASPTPELVPPRLMTVVGVMPPAFELPTGPMDYYTPFVVDPSQRSPQVTLFGRLRPGVSLIAALEEANTLGAAIVPPPAGASALDGTRFLVSSTKERLVETLRPALRVLLSAVAVVLLIVCANVANLLLARGTTRQREIAVRIAIGASRAQVVQQVLAECVVLAAAGGALGAAVGAAGVTLVKNLSAVDAPGIFRLGFGTSILPRGHELGIDPKLFAIAFGIAAMTAIVFGVLPALHMSRASSLRAMGSRGAGTARRETRIRAAMAIAQLAMATVLLVGAGLLLRSFVRLAAVERGYDPANVLAFRLVLPPEYSVARKTDTIDAILMRLRALPSVEAAGFSRAGILIGEALTIGTFVPPGRTLDEMRTNAMGPLLRSVSAGYLSAVGAHLLDGRDFDATDVTAPAAPIVITRSVARQFFGTSRAVGQTVDWHAGKGRPSPMRIVGVVDDVRNTAPDQPPDPEIFVEYRHLLALQQQWGDSAQRREQLAIGFLSFALRTTGDPAATAPAVTKVVQAVDANAGIDAMIPMERLVASSVASPRFYAVLLGVFAGVAGLLAAIGTYGVVAYAVVERTREIGIRIALGAQPRGVLALVLRQGAILTTAGIALGLIGAAAATRLLQSMLFDVAPLDRMTFAAVALIFAAVATLASYVPARRATRVDPVVALRSE